MVGGNSSPQIDAVSPRDRAETLELVYSYLQPDERRRQIAEVLASVPASEATPCEGLLAARRNGRLVGAIFSQVAPGKTAHLWLPRLMAAEPESTAARLLAATWGLLSDQRVVLAQVLLPAVDKIEKAVLRRGGIHHLANLLYLVSPTDQQHSVARWSEHGDWPADRTVTPEIASSTRAMHFEPYHENDRRRLAELFAATCEGTLDCPKLGSLRRPDDILAGFRVSGEFDPCRWLIVRQQHRDVGCLLLADHPRHDTMELLYLGLIPAARGKGWGRQLAAHARWLARVAGRRRLVLAVDAVNWPAVQTYMAAGFRAWQRRRLYVRRLASADSWHASFQQVIHAPARATARIFPAAESAS
jgi:mycothiol synthase